MLSVMELIVLFHNNFTPQRWAYSRFDSTKSLGYVTDVSKYHNAGIYNMA